MATFRSGTVIEITEARDGLQRVVVTLDGESSPSKAYALTALIGDVAVGDEVVCNTTAVDRGLGTGGWHVIHWNLSRRAVDTNGPDHIMKLRYTSLQADVGTSELEYPDLPATVGSTPVVACLVHSQVAAVAALARETRPEARIVYVMTDGAALPLVLSDLVAGLVADGVIDGTVTTGHAFGGDLEAVTTASGIGLARHVLDSDIIVVGMGPGVVGTGTPLGTTAIEAAGIVNTAAAMGGIPVLAVRASSGDARPRHRGISHHTVTALGLCLAPPHVVDVPGHTGDLRGATVHEIDTSGVLPTLERRVPGLRTMGRGLHDDVDFFIAAGAAGILAAALSHDA